MTSATLTTAETAALLHVDVRTVHRMAGDGRLTPVSKDDGPTGAYQFAEGEVRLLASQLAEQAAAEAEQLRAAASAR